MGQFRYRNSVTLSPLGHSAHEMYLMWNILERVKLNPTWTELFFIIRKMLYKIGKFFYHRVGLNSIIFQTKYFEQKHVLTARLYSLNPLYTKINFNKYNFLILCASFRIFHVYDFLSIFYLTEQLEKAYRKSLDSMQ